VQRLVDGVYAGWNDIAARCPRHLASPTPIADLATEVALLAPVTLTHNDLHAHNVLVDADRVVFVDWQNATFSTPMLDVANLIAGCVRPEVQRGRWTALLAHYEESLRRAGGPELPDVVARYATASGLLFAWVCDYLANVSDAEAEGRPMLLQHWERVCTGVMLPR
jgi:thiamine kinase-like enzyme